LLLQTHQHQEDDGDEEEREDSEGTPKSGGSTPRSARDTLKKYSRSSPEAHVKLSFGDKLKASLNTPVYVALFSLLVGSIPPVKGLFFGENAIFYDSVVKATEGCGRAVYPIVIVILGFNLGMPKEQFQSHASKTEMAAVTITRLILMPLIGMALVMPLFNAGVIYDSVMAFVIMVEFSAPTAINLLVIAALHQSHEARMSKLLLVQYVAGIFTLTAWSYSFLQMVRVRD